MREPGFYWVKEFVIGDRWTIAEYIHNRNFPNFGYWVRLGFELNWGDEDFLEIGEKIERK